MKQSIWLYRMTITLAVFFTYKTALASPKATLHKELAWTEVPGRTLTADIYTPTEGQAPYPVVVIYHGGGWLINDMHIMDDMARYLAEEGGYVVANMNYRLLGDNRNRVTMNEIVNDALGGLIWVKSHIHEYDGDPERVAVTGDSAGGHLASMVLLAGSNLQSGDFGKEGRFGFAPSYLPEGRTAEDLSGSALTRVQAAVISYGAFDLEQAAKHGFESPQNGFWAFAGQQARGMFGEDIDVNHNPDYYRAVSPIDLIPSASERSLPPQWHHVGSDDRTTPADRVQAYVTALKQAGHKAELTVYPNRRHAYLDSGCSDYFGTCFDKDALPVMSDMLKFLELHLKTGAAHSE